MKSVVVAPPPVEEREEEEVQPIGTPTRRRRKPDEIEQEEAEEPAASTTRINLKLTQRQRAFLDGVAKRKECSLSTVLGFSISLVKIFVECEDHGDKLVVADSKNEVKSAILAPWF